MSEKKTRTYKYSYDIGEYLKHPNKVAVFSTRYFEVVNWLTENIDDYLLLGYSSATWVLGLHSEEDFVLFKLRFQELGNV